MTNLDQHGDLAAVEVAFFSISFLLGVLICLKQGSFLKNASWLYLVTISILRIIGSSCTVYLDTQHDNSSSLQETVVITSSVGTAPLLLVLMGLLARMHSQMEEKRFSPNIFRPIHLLSLVALALAIVGGVKESEGNSDDYHTGKSCTEAATILFVFVWLVLAIITVLTTFRRVYLPETEKKLLIAATCVLPFLLVRVIYSTIVGFASPGSDFFIRSVNVWIQAFMQFTMEAIAIILYTWAGLFTPKQASAPRDTTNTAKYTAKAGDVESGNVPRSRAQRTIGDYRPSRLVMNAVRDRS